MRASMVMVMLLCAGGAEARGGGGHSGGGHFGSSHTSASTYGYGTGAKSESNYVHSYTKRDGTYVEPHNRSTQDGTKTNNWSTKGNVNPDTGKPGTKSAY